jgi:nitrogen fixation NifU-like protein
MDNSSMYKEHILELWKHPENYGVLRRKTHELRGFNESCGDDITIQILVDKDKVADVAFTGKGCALCMASASLLTEKMKGMDVNAVLKMTSKDIFDLLEINVHPARIKCVLLSLNTVQKVLKK